MASLQPLLLLSLPLLSSSSPSYFTMDLPAIDESPVITEVIQTGFTVPESYEFVKAYPNCVNPIRDQGQCGSCWAFAATGSLGDRVCVRTGVATRLSPQDLLDCELMNIGCKLGSLPGPTWKFLEKKGVAHEMCQPYESGVMKKKFKCGKTCRDGLPKNLTKAHNVTHLKGVNSIMAAVAEGPVDVTFNVYGDLYTHWEKRTNETYVHAHGGFKGIHSVKVVGYGVDDMGVPYWTVENSWGGTGGFDFGNRRGGYFRIKRGNNECGIEKLVYAGWPVLS